MRNAITVIQAATFVVLGAILFTEGNWRLGTAQACLAAVTGLVYL